MNQILHIFRKDTRRFWPEILLSVTANLALSLILPARWKINHQLTQNLLPLLTFIVPAGWWLLIARVIHAESLVGDGQFWITRPYQWKNLLAAKAVFLAAWIGLPFIAAQLLLIAEAGFPVTPYISTVLVNLAVITAMLLLPLAAIATVTANFARMTLALIGGVVAVVALAFVLAFFTIRSYSAFNPIEDHISLPLEFAGAVLIIVLQYATRRTWVTRGLLCGFVLVLFSLAWFYRSQALVSGAYASPFDTKSPPLRVALDPAYAPSASVEEKDVRLNLPVSYADVDEKSAALVENVRFSLTAANGATWTSPWIDHRVQVLSNAPWDLLELTMDTSTFDRFQYSPVALHVTFAITEVHATSITTVPIPAAAAVIPGLGICSSNHNHSFLLCRSVVRQTPLTYVSETGSTTGDCTTGQPTASPVRGTWSGSTQRQLSYSAFNPISISTIRWGGWEPENAPHWRLCPDSPLTLTQYRVVDRTTVELVLPNFTLPPVATVNSAN
jgi:hypothetical protein